MKLRKGSKCVQSGYVPQNGQPRQVPIIQSTTFYYDSNEQMEKLFALEESGYFYSRLQNPTNDNVAAKIADLEGGVAAMLTSSGQAANFFAVFNICTNGDHVICSSELYGGTYNLFAVTMKKMGISFTFLSPNASDEQFDTAFQPNTKLVFAETLSNPSLTVLDIERVAEIAHAHEVPLIVDNTLPTPINCRPIEFGADIVTHSTTKYMDGHASCVGGVIVDSGNFDWAKYPDKFPELNQPDASYNGVIYTQRFGAGAYITKAVVQLMRDLGAQQAPHQAYILSLGLESLHLRMKQHTESAKAVALFLENHPKVSWINCVELPSSSQYTLAQKYMPDGSCGVVSFGLKGGRKAASDFMKEIKIASIATHVADARSCILHPASTTHSQLTEHELIAAGVPDDMIRFSVGIEDTQDILEDLARVLG